MLEDSPSASPAFAVVRRLRPSWSTVVRTEQTYRGGSACPLCEAKRTLLSERVMSAPDPYVWSGRALQEDFFGLADVRSRINVSGL
jgi:hypothetical protein